MLNVQQFFFKNSSIILAQKLFRHLAIRILKVHLMLVASIVFDWAVTLELLWKRYGLMLFLALVHIWLLLKKLSQQKIIRFFILDFAV